MKKLLIILTIFISILVSCKKDSGFGLEIYLLTDYQSKNLSKEIIPGSEKLSKNPIIYYHDIIFYDSTNHYFQIEPSKAEEFYHINWTTQGTAFSLTVNKVIIYSGYFMPGYSSSSADWFIIDPFSVDSKIYTRLGYPGELDRLVNIDPRNDHRIIDLLKRDNKLR
jgi:hypothetical protein